jgi:hypothetical protein
VLAQILPVHNLKAISATISSDDTAIVAITDEYTNTKVRGYTGIREAIVFFCFCVSGILAIIRFTPANIVVSLGC